jgi:MerR family transcriptional regulator, light-induced transcriptional regulator
MDKFSIQDIENLTGIKAHTLRVWERRYDFIKSKRKLSNHRYYDDVDLKQLLKITTLYKHGMKLTKINSLSEAEINALAYKFDAVSNTYDSFINQLIEATIDFDEGRFDQILKNCILSIGMNNTILKVAYPLMEKIGSLWLTQHIHSVQEHFCTLQIRNMLITAIENIKIDYKTSNHFLLCTPKEEFHEIPLLFIHYHLKKEGNRVCYLGINSTLENVSLTLSKIDATHIWIHMVTNLSFDYRQHFINYLKNKFNTQIILSGPNAIKFNHEEDERLITLKSMDDILEKLIA